MMRRGASRRVEATCATGPRLWRRRGADADNDSAGMNAVVLAGARALIPDMTGFRV
jgi:hypothetical protein